MDRLDVEVAEQREKISVEVLQQSESLGPPTKIATVEIPATVLLAEASGKKERVALLDAATFILLWSIACIRQKKIEIVMDKFHVSRKRHEDS